MTFRKTIPLLAGLALAASSLRAETADEREFKQLREQRDKAIAAAIDPINRRYQWSLEQLLRHVSQAVEPELARQVQAELQAASGSAAAAAVANAPANLVPATRPATKGELGRLFEESEWQYYITPEPTGQNKGLIVFHKEGKKGGCAATDSFPAVWYEVEASGLLLVHQEPPNVPKRTIWAFRIDYGNKTASFDPSASTTSGRGCLKFSRPVKSSH